MGAKARKARLDRALAAMLASTPTPPHLAALARAIAAEPRRA
jgi:hypothetical protein